MRVVSLLLAALLSFSLGAAHATGKQGASKATSSKSSKSASAKPSVKAPKRTASKPASARKAVPAPKAAAPRTTACKPVKGKKTCATAAATVPVAKTYSSPIAADSLDKKNAAQSGDELKARTVPDRAYAIDGQTFFHQGRRIRIEGLNSASATATGEHAKQRLQTMLDSGNLSIEQIAIDDSGVATAQVRVNGRDLATQLNAN